MFILIKWVIKFVTVNVDCELGEKWRFSKRRCKTSMMIMSDIMMKTYYGTNIDSPYSIKEMIDNTKDSLLGGNAKTTAGGARNEIQR